jgi:hypothetical protein
LIRLREAVSRIGHKLDVIIKRPATTLLVFLCLKSDTKRLEGTLMIKISSELIPQKHVGFVSKESIIHCAAIVFDSLWQVFAK